jgi:NAD(P)H-dependent FMN reductase
MIKIAILTGSTRPSRFNDIPADWLYKLTSKIKGASFELIDIAQLNLPFLDEPEPAGSERYTKNHTKQWSKKISSIDGFVFVTPEYNHGISPALKNAVDYLYVEWNFKPIAFVSYGSLAGGSRAVEHWRGIAGELKMYDIREQVMFPNYWDNFNVDGSFNFTEKTVKNAEAMMKSLLYWAKIMKDARLKMKK